ncbi:hypothetical protein [Nostoc sp. MG11]|uniref:hypothetical protein n=1 Tax=Nostoc sp. MG11 TaxID=2721166 RepID=UPI001867E59A|nr:hypothetical protein [Nostoc sp. MG11]
MALQHAIDYLLKSAIADALAASIIIKTAIAVPFCKDGEITRRRSQQLLKIENTSSADFAEPKCNFSRAS